MDFNEILPVDNKALDILENPGSSTMSVSKRVYFTYPALLHIYSVMWQHVHAGFYTS